MDKPVLSHIEALRKNHSAPIVIGFGISKPEHVKAAIASGADGAIAGSATVLLIEKYMNHKSAMLAELSDFSKKMKDATRSSSETLNAKR
jgi:tryptophan synthase alpha chain